MNATSEPESLLAFPCDFPIKVMGETQPGFAQAVMSVVLRHALKPALIPMVSFLGPALAGIITGSIVIETIFGLPGIGRAFVDGALNRDYTVVMGVTVLYGALIVVFNFLADVAYSVLDPRVRYE